MTIHSPGHSALPLTLDFAGLANILPLAPSTVQKNVSRSPSSLPPHIKVGGKQKPIWMTQISLAWNSDPSMSTPIILDLREFPPILDSFQLASILHISESSIDSMYYRFPSSLPPRGVYGWVTHDVFKWLVKGLIGLPATARVEITAPVFLLYQVPVRRTLANDLSSLRRGER
jgi:hypothetical protein